MGGLLGGRDGGEVSTLLHRHCKVAAAWAWAVIDSFLIGVALLRSSLVSFVYVQVEKERELREKERRIHEEEARIERERRVQEEQARLREEQERRATARAVREEQDRRDRDRRQREDRERERDKERQEHERREREIEEIKRKQDSKDALSRVRKRPFSGDSFEPSPKKTALHDVRGGSSDSAAFTMSPGVFSRLGPGQNASPHAQADELGMEGGGGYRRGGGGDTKQYERGGMGMGRGGGGGYKLSGVPQAGSSRERPAADGVGYPIASRSMHGMHPGGAAALYAKSLGAGMVGGGGGVQQAMRARPTVAGSSAAAAQITPDLISVAQALQSIQKAVAGGGGQPHLSPGGGRLPGQLPASQIQQQLATAAAQQGLPAFLGLGQSGGHLAAAAAAAAVQGAPTMAALQPQGVAEMLLGKSGSSKLPPEGERYNRRLNRLPTDGSGGSGGHRGMNYMYRRGM